MYFITFSEMLGTHGEKIARQTASALNYAFFGEEELHKAAKEMDFFSDVKELDEKSPNFLERFFSFFSRIIASDLSCFSAFHTSFQGTPLFVAFSQPLLCLTILSFRLSVCPLQ